MNNILFVLVFVARGGYALKLEDGTIRKMYDGQYEELFTPIA